MLKTKIFNTINVNAVTSKKKKKKIPTNLILKKTLFCFHLSLLVNDFILIYLEIIILSIYNILIPYGFLFGWFFFFIFQPPLV